MPNLERLTLRERSKRADEAARKFTEHVCKCTKCSTLTSLCSVGSRFCNQFFKYHPDSKRS